MIYHGLRGTFEDLVADILEKTCTPPPVPNPIKVRHLEVSTSSQPKPECPTLFMVRGRLSAHRHNCSHSGVHALLQCGPTSDFMSMQMAKRAQLPLYKLTHPGHVMTDRGVQVEVRYYTRAYVRVGKCMYFDTTLRSVRFCRTRCLGYHGLAGIARLSTGRSGMRTNDTNRLRTNCPSMDPEIPPGYSFKQLRSLTSFEHFHAVR